MGDNIRMDIRELELEGVDISEGSCEHANEPLVSIRGEEFLY
jgi:hypothetical protein